MYSYRSERIKSINPLNESEVYIEFPRTSSYSNSSASTMLPFEERVLQPIPTLKMKFSVFLKIT